MRPRLGGNELHIHSHGAAELADAALNHIPHAELLAKASCVGGLPLVGRSQPARDHQQSRRARKVGGQIVGDRISEIAPASIAAQIVERQHDEREPRRTGSVDGFWRGRSKPQAVIVGWSYNWLRDHRDEAIPPAGHGLDAASAGSSGIEDPTKRRDLYREVAFLDHRPRPDGTHDLILRHQIAWSFGEHPEHCERTGAEADRLVTTIFGASAQERVAAVETERPEEQDVG